MHLRAVDWIALGVAFPFGAALPSATFGGDSARLLITFLGLVSAGILPTVSLVIGLMASSGRSVQAVNELKTELQAAIEALLALFGFGVLAVAALLVLSLPLHAWGDGLPYIAEGTRLFAQGTVCGASTLIVFRAGQVSAILRRSLEIKHKIAVDEAKRETSDNAPSAKAVRDAFPTHPDYGRTTKIR